VVQLVVDNQVSSFVIPPCLNMLQWSSSSILWVQLLLLRLQVVS
jgi:hypothetical protein